MSELSKISGEFNFRELYAFCIKSADVKDCFAWLHFFQTFQNLFQDLRQQRQKVEDIGLMYHVVGEPIRNIEG